jgi:cytochrome c5
MGTATAAAAAATSLSEKEVRHKGCAYCHDIIITEDCIES